MKESGLKGNVMVQAFLLILQDSNLLDHSNADKNMEKEVILPIAAE